MKVLFVCAQGISSTIAVNALKKEAEKKGIEIEILAIYAEAFEEEIKNNWGVSMIAPQVRHRFNELKLLAEEAGVPCELIHQDLYSPLGGPKLLKQILELYNK